MMYTVFNEINRSFGGKNYSYKKFNEKIFLSTFAEKKINPLHTF